MFCMNCGKHIDDNSRFCLHCGHPVGTFVPNENAGQQVARTTTEPVAGGIKVVKSSKGERSEVFVSCSTASVEAIQTAEQILLNNGFSQADYHGESVWTKGTKGITCAQYIKLLPTSNSLGIQAWILDGIGSISFKEQSLRGIRLAVWKKRLLTVVESIQQSL